MGITVRDINEFIEKAGMPPHLTEVFPLGSCEAKTMVAYEENNKLRLIIDEVELGYEDFKDDCCKVRRVWRNGIESSCFKCCGSCVHMHKERTFNSDTGYCDLKEEEKYLDTDVDDDYCEHFDFR